jgi:CHAT domain-containing protein
MAENGAPDALQSAIDAYKVSYVLAAINGMDSHCQVVATNLGNLYSADDKWEEAALAYRYAMDASDRLYASTIMFGARQEEVGQAADLPLRLAYAYARGKNGIAAVTALERGRSRWIGEALARDQVDLATARQVDPVGCRAFEEAAERVRQLEADDMLRASLLPRDLESDDVMSPPSDGRLQEVQASRARLEDSAKRLSERTSLRVLAGPTWSEISSCVKVHRPLVYILTCREGTALLIVARTDKPAPATVDILLIDSFTLRQLADLTRDPTTHKLIAGYFGARKRDLDSFGARLEVAMAQLGSHIARPTWLRLRELRAHGVTVVPCGQLTLWPLHAASFEVAGETHCLLGDFDIAFSASAALASRGISAEREPYTFLVGVGNPRPTTAPLRFGALELAEVATHFENRVCFFGRRATKGAFLDALDRSTHVHMSCHARFDPSQPLTSGLKLGDSQLGIPELIAMRPFQNVHLAVASACETAVSFGGVAPDEHLGLHVAMLLAGAGQVIGTLWSVEDLATALLVSRLYAMMQPAATIPALRVSPARALRSAQVWLRDVTVADLRTTASKEHTPGARFWRTVYRYFDAAPASRRPFRHPFYWAGFVLVGSESEPALSL